MTIHGWKQLAWWSIEYSCLSDGDKVKAREIFDREWEEFCVWVIKEFSAEAEKLDIQP
jgi:adenosine deaminase CECR1